MSFSDLLGDDVEKPEETIEEQYEEPELIEE